MQDNEMKKTASEQSVISAAVNGEIPQDWSDTPAEPIGDDGAAAGKETSSPLSDAQEEAKAPVNIPRKKNKKKLIIILSIVGAAVIIGAIVLILILSPKQEADDDLYDDGSYVNVAAATRFNGVVEPQETVKVKRDGDLTIGKVFVEPGDAVKKGDVLFSYDSDEAKLNLELAQLEYDGINNEITGYNNQIAELTKQRADAPEDQKLDYTLQIQQAELSRSRAQMNLKQKKVEIDNLKKKVNTADVKSPIDGVIKSVASSGSSDGDTDGADNDAFITILTTDAYRVKGSVDELNVGLLYEGMSVLVHSRADESIVWNGTISKIDTEDNTAENNQNSYYDYGSSGDSATKYTFYVTLEDADDILMGQHVYIEPLYDDAELTLVEGVEDGALWDGEVEPDKDAD